jgi:hypothetical protein
MTWRMRLKLSTKVEKNEDYRRGLIFRTRKNTNGYTRMIKKFDFGAKKEAALESTTSALTK